MITQEIGKAWNYFRKYGLSRTIFDRDTPFLIQFGKYGICGVISLLVFITVTTIGRSLYPQHFSLDLSQSTRSWNNSLIQFIAFIPSNLIAYILNRWLVFTPGRHQVRKEFALFTLISFLSFSLGLILPVWLVQTFNALNKIADLSFIISSAMVNFVCRKFFVFEK